MICSKCYCVVDEEAIACPHCGHATQSVASQQLLVDKTNKGLAFLSFVLSAFVPQGVIFGFILWATKTDLQPKSARVYGLCAVIPWLLKWLVPKVTRLVATVICVAFLVVVILVVAVLAVLVFTGVIPMPAGMVMA